MSQRLQWPGNSRIFVSALVAGCCCLVLGTSTAGRERRCLDDDWKFWLGDPPAAHQPGLETSAWQSIRLPHDWSIDLPRNAQAASRGSGGFFATGTAWYRRDFTAPAAWRGKRVEVEFEGVSPNAAVWLNGQLLGQHAYGYTPFRSELSKHLRYGQSNTLAVRVNNSLQPNSRWYTGSGIYRHVWLDISEPVCVDAERVFVTTRDTALEKATVTVAVPVVNSTSDNGHLRLEIDLRNPQGKTVARQAMECGLPPQTSQTVMGELSIKQPQRWSPQTPRLYRCLIRLLRDGQEADQAAIPFGVRTVRATSRDGLLLNGQPILLCGANVHHDNGPLGAAAFDRAEWRRVRLLKAAGFNAVRTAHNPPSTAFLHACDQLGMLVVLEVFDGWAAKKNPYDYGMVFDQLWQRDLTAAVCRDRNHPSIIMWSLGNEVYERGKPEGRAIAQQMSRCVRQLDNTRLVTAGINGLGPNGDWKSLDPLFASLDVAGYNYELDRYREDHARVPERVNMSAESYPRDAFAGWRASEEVPYVIGDFVWSGMDYLGEAGIGRVFGPVETVLPHWEGEHFPWHGAGCGDIDFTGWRKPLSHYRKIVWDRGEKLYVSVRVPPPPQGAWQLSAWAHPPSLPCWSWPDQQGKPVTVEVFSRYPTVRLYLNDQLLGEQPTDREQQFRTEFKVDYAPGELKAVGMEDGFAQESCVLETAGEPNSIRMMADQARISANGQSLVFIDVQVLDQDHRACWHADHEVRYSVDGPGTIAGVGSGDVASEESYLSPCRRVYLGRSLLIVRSTGQAGTIRIQASAAGLISGEVSILACAGSSMGKPAAGESPATAIR